MPVLAAMAMSSSGALDFLSRGAISIKGRMAAASNITLLAELTLDGTTELAIYKPERGERPLWDFPPGLYKREVAAYRLSEALGWGLVPLTILREGPHGMDHSSSSSTPTSSSTTSRCWSGPSIASGSCGSACSISWRTTRTGRAATACSARTITIYAIDNGLTFHAEPKLRTVIWDFAGEPIPRAAGAAIERLLDEGVPDTVAELLDRQELDALLARGKALTRRVRFPKDASGMRYPWPLL